MKLSQSGKASIKRQILADIYDKPIHKLTELKTKLVLRNHNKFLEETTPSLIGIQEDLITKSNSVKMTFKYKEVPYSWMASYVNPVICPVKLTSHSVTPIGIDTYSELYNEVISLHEEDEELHSKRADFESYLNNVFSAYSGPNQLKKVLPDYLHKYIPKPGPRAKAKPKAKAEIPTIKAPDFVKEQLVENLLENT